MQPGLKACPSNASVDTNVETMDTIMRGAAKVTAKVATFGISSQVTIQGRKVMVVRAVAGTVAKVDDEARGRFPAQA